jgi:hypothetical protein
MRTLIYKRTHPGDPDRKGRFGIEDCMGQVRTWRFDAVIGVGGIGAEPKSHGLDRVGTARRGPVLTFDHFWLRESRGPSFTKMAPRLAARLYSRNVRVVRDSLDDEERREVDRVLALAKDAAPSSGYGPHRASTGKGCVPKKPCAKPIKDCSR